jgi:energy-coupling factor transporter ATP-binding protein EcfA2
MIQFAQYGFTYSGAERPSISDLTVDLAGGQVVSVVAAQGRGKTTLLRAAAGLLGPIYEGQASGSLICSDHGRPGAFFEGYVQVTLAVETVREEIGLPLYPMGMSRTQRDASVDAVARELRIEHLLDRDVTALSGGEEKLVGIAAALVPSVGVHVLDEPFEQLDVSHLAAVIRAVKIRARQGRLILVGTGSVDTALNICDSALVFDDNWRRIDKPTYSDLAPLAGLGVSSLGSFLHRHSAREGNERRFRDAVRRVS